MPILKHCCFADEIKLLGTSDQITLVAKSSPPTYFSDMSFTPTADAINARVGTGVECCGSKDGLRIHLGHGRHALKLQETFNGLAPDET